MNRGRFPAHRDVLADSGEARTGLTGALIQRRLSRKLVREVTFIGHEQSVPARRFRQGRVPLQGRQLLRGAFAVSGIEEKPFLFRRLRGLLRWQTTRRDEE
jgi:hypothetical protein